MPNVAAKLLETGITLPVDKNGIEIDPNKPSPAYNFLNLQIVQISLVGADIKAIGMSGDKRPLGDLAKFPKTCVIHVGYVDNNPVGLQFFHRLFA